MATYYATEFVDVTNGSLPAQLADGRPVASKVRSHRATKPATALASGDLLYIGRLPVGAVVTNIQVTTDTSFGTSTLSIGTIASPTKYANAVTNTVVDKPVIIGPKASAAVLAPLTTEEQIYLTVGTATIVAGTVAAFVIEYKIAS